MSINLIPLNVRAIEAPEYLADRATRAPGFLTWEVTGDPSTSPEALCKISTQC